MHKPWSGRRLQVGQVKVARGRVHWRVKHLTDHMSFGAYDARKFGEYLIKAANFLEYPDIYGNPDDDTDHSDEKRTTEGKTGSD